MRTHIFLYTLNVCCVQGGGDFQFMAFRINLRPSLEISLNGNVPIDQISTSITFSLGLNTIKWGSASDK